MRLRAGAIFVVAFVFAAIGGSAGQSPVETGSILVSLIERPIGRETYELRKDGQGWQFTGDLNLTERGGALQYKASLHLDADLTPRRLTAAGRTYRFVNSDVTVEIADRTAQVTQFGETTRVPVPGAYFAALSYAPVSARALLIRYWEKHGQPADLTVVPGTPTRTVRIRSRGTDAVRAGAETVRLKRYTVDGVVWGRETVWLDERDRFAAIVSRIHILPLEAVREDLKDAWPLLQASSVRDAVDDLAAMSKSAAPVADGAFALVGATVVDGTDRPPLEDGTVIVRDGRIAEVGAERSCDAATDTPADRCPRQDHRARLLGHARAREPD